MRFARSLTLARSYHDRPQGQVQANSFSQQAIIQRSSLSGRSMP